jgi:D-alanine-D-alanine ligase
MRFSVMIFYGGPSYEHDVSIMSAKNIIDFLKTKKNLLIYPVYIDKKGRWYLTDLNLDRIKKLCGIVYDFTGRFFIIGGKRVVPDVCFSIIHGNLGEDGKLQGFFETISAVYSGCDVLSSAIAMNKKLSKTIAKLNGISVLDDVTFSLVDFNTNKQKILDEIKKLGLPVFVKPNNLGSSVGVFKVKRFDDIERMIKKSFEYDDVVMVEKGLERPKEVVCGVLLDNGEIYVSRCGEVVVSKKHEFYDYNAKYIDPNGMQLKIPADITKDVEEKIQKYSAVIFKAIGGFGFSRVDFFVDRNDSSVYFCEINTIPGFTSHSLFPSLFKYTGVDLNNQLKIIITGGFFRNRRINKAKLERIRKVFENE